MEAAAAATVMGPRPGLAIVKFWQGVVEIVLRVITIVSINQFAKEQATSSHVAL